MSILPKNYRILHKLNYYPICRCLHTEKLNSHDFVNFEDEYFKNQYIPTNFFQKTLLTIGSATISLVNPARGDMIACLGETAGPPALRYILNRMRESQEGREILKEQPRINSRTVDLEKLKTMPDNTLGRWYSNFLTGYNYSPDDRPPVQFVDDVELAYVAQRYREVHDLFHTILAMPTHMLGEVTVKWVEGIQLKLPMCIGGAIFGPIRLKPKHRQLYLLHYLPWAVQTGTSAEFLMNVYFEKRWDQPIEDLHRELNIKLLTINKNKK